MNLSAPHPKFKIISIRIEVFLLFKQLPIKKLPGFIPVKYNKLMISLDMRLIFSGTQP